MQAQMTPATAPGIAGLMQGKPQSPTAGLGNVPQRIGAYGEQGLAQKNAVTQDLLDLMAAQKLKAEKEAAARQMQLQAAQQGQPLTVAQSLDKELLDMTKQELAPQQAPQQAAPGVAQASQQQEQQKQSALQRLAQGITRAPGADQVMPQRMAGGGIVAFQEGGEAPSAVDQREVQRILRKSPMMRTPEENAILRQAGLKLEQRQMGPEGIIQRAERGLQQVGPAARQYLTEGAQGLSPEDLEQRSDAGAVTEKLYRMLGGQQARPPVQPDTMQAEEQRLLGRFPAPQAAPSTPQAAPSTPQAAPPMRMPPAQVRSKVPVQGVPAALEKPVLPPESPQGGIPQSVQPPTSQSSMQEMLNQMQKYRQGEFAEMSKLAKELYALPPEVRQILEQRIAQAKQAAQPAPQDFAGLFAELGGFDPSKGIASAYNQMMGAQRAQQEKLRSGVTAAENALIQAQEAARLEAAKTALGARGKSSETFGTLANVDVSRQGVEAQREATASRAAESAADRVSQERRLEREIAARRELKQMEINNPEWKSKLIYALRNPQAASLMFPKSDKAALDYLKLQVDLKQSQMQALANDLSPDAVQRKKELAAEVATLSRALGELSGVPLSQPRPSAPAVGTVMQGYRFKGGDPSDRKNWEKV